MKKSERTEELIKRAGIIGPIIAIYENPKNYPGKYVARVWSMQKPTKIKFVANTLEQIKKYIPEDMVFVRRCEKDDQCIIGTYI